LGVFSQVIEDDKKCAVKIMTRFKSDQTILLKRAHRFRAHILKSIYSWFWTSSCITVHYRSAYEWERATGLPWEPWESNGNGNTDTGMGI